MTINKEDIDVMVYRDVRTRIRVLHQGIRYGVIISSDTELTEEQIQFVASKLPPESWHSDYEYRLDELGRYPERHLNHFTGAY